MCRLVVHDLLHSSLAVTNTGKIHKAALRETLGPPGNSDPSLHTLIPARPG